MDNLHEHPAQDDDAPPGIAKLAASAEVQAMLDRSQADVEAGRAEDVEALIAELLADADQLETELAARQANTPQH